MPVDHTPSARVDVRVVAATHRDLRQAVSEGQFREDLYYRLAQLTLHMPRLRDRDSDVTLLAQLFLDEVGRTRGGPLAFTDEALTALAQHSWPGNVRELRNAVQRAAYLQREGRVDRAQLRLSERAPQRRERIEDMILAGDSHEAIHAAVDEMILARLLERHGTITALARALGKSRDTTRKMLARAGLYPRS